MAGKKCRSECVRECFPDCTRSLSFVPLSYSELLETLLHLGGLWIKAGKPVDSIIYFEKAHRVSNMITS